MRGSRTKIALLWLVMFGAAAAVFGSVQTLGAGLAADGAPPVTRAGPSGAADHSLDRLLLAVTVVIAVAHTFGFAAGKLGQPKVIGEIVAGLFLGPSAFGRLAPTFHAAVFVSAAPALDVLAQVGVVLFMFLVGLRLDTGVLRTRTHQTVAISHSSIVVPFALGSALAVWLYPRFGVRGVPFLAFSMFIGLAMSVTAFPVLSRILTDLKISHTHVGIVAISAAAIDDVTAWCLLAVVAGVVRSNGRNALLTIVLSGLYVAIVATIGRRALRVLFERTARAEWPTQSRMALMVIALFASALATQLIGIHALFGAFLAGAVIPHDSTPAVHADRALDDVTAVILLPLFFAYTGMRTQIALVQGWEGWAACAGIVVVACAGKFGGATLAARATAMTWRDAATVGALMNTRGLMELIVLNLGLDLGVISPALFAAMVIMAVLTTIATSPIVRRLQHLNRSTVR